MRKIFTLIAAALFAVTSLNAETKTVQWKAKDAKVNGQKNIDTFTTGADNDEAITVAFGATGDWSTGGNQAITLTVNGSQYSFEKNFITTSTNGKDDNTKLEVDGSTPYNYLGFVPKYDGVLTVVLQTAGGNKKVKVRENGDTMTGTIYRIEGTTSSIYENVSTLDPEGDKDKSYNVGISFEVSKNSEYTISLGGSKARWSGFIFSYETEAVPAVDPEFSLTKYSIYEGLTSQIQVGDKGGLNGIKLSEITYGTPGIVEVDENGVVTALSAGTTTVSFKSSEVEGKYNAGEGSVTIEVIAFTPKTFADLTPVSASASWDFAKIPAVDTQTSSREWFAVSDAVAKGLLEEIPEAFGDATQLFVAADYLSRSSGSSNAFQGAGIAFNAGVKGTVTIGYSHTGGTEEKPKDTVRKVVINGQTIGNGANSTKVVTEKVEVEPGTVKITFVEEAATTPSSISRADDFDTSVGSNVRVYTLSFEPDNTSALDIIAADQETETVIYDLLGRRVQNPSNGIYIVNGKKVLVK